MIIMVGGDIVERILLMFVTLLRSIVSEVRCHNHLSLAAIGPRLNLAQETSAILANGIYQNGFLGRRGGMENVFFFQAKARDSWMILGFEESYKPRSR